MGVTRVFTIDNTRGNLPRMRWWEAGTPGNDQDLAELLRDEHLEQEPEQRSVMAEMLTPEDVDRYQIAPGRWYLPGTPP